MDKTTRRDLKRQYLESHRPTGVFRLRNKVDDRSWVATSVNLPATFNKLRMQLDTGSFLMLPELQKDWKRLGADSFELEVLEELEPPDAPEWDPREALATLEALWLEQLEPYQPRGYNRPPRAAD
jgi:hypothetical protein